MYVIKEIIAVILIAFAVTTLPLQILGFITPYWACHKKAPTVSYYRASVEDHVCDMEGLFYTCNGLQCQPKVLDSLTFVLSLTSLVITCFTALLLTKFGHNMLTTKAKIDVLYARNKETLAFAVFSVGQLLAGGAWVKMSLNYLVYGWSSILFSTLPSALVALFIVIFRLGNFFGEEGVFIPSFLFGLHVPLTGILVLIYFKGIKPYFKRRVRERTRRLKAGPSAPNTDPNRPKTLELPLSVISESVQYLPSYWSKKSDPIRKINITSDARFIKLLVYHLWSPKDVGVGKDAANVGNNKFIKITKVQRVENVALFLKYNENREKLLRKEETVQCFKDLSQLSTSEVRTTELINNIPELARSPLGREMHHDINEHYLFHGTVPQNVQSICRTGLSVYYVARAMFGKGVYTAESPTKSDQYTDYPGETAVHKDKKLLLCRVCLGELYISKMPNDKLISPPCRTCYAPDCKKHELTFDSAVGDVTGLRFREFIVYRDYRIYPEYIITYDRVEDDAEMGKYIDR